GKTRRASSPLHSSRMDRKALPRFASVSSHAPGARPGGSCSTRRTLGHAARHETPDRDAIAFVSDGPNHRPAEQIRHRDHRIVGKIDPRRLEAHAIMAILGFPIRIRDSFAVRHRTAESSPAREMIEPRLERRVGVSAVKVASCYVADETRYQTKSYTKYDA